jgi:hypothetical protein
MRDAYSFLEGSEMKLSEPRAYDALRTIVEELGGSMEASKKGSRFGLWTIRLGSKVLELECPGNETLPELDQFYVPRPGVEHPQTWNDLSAELKDGAIGRFLEMVYRDG